ncbi:AI-2E family transporter [Caldibacillus debilis]|uniref:AI-2E family transporter n=1 Tax=Caldibacillus debilis TaxID=301148 RepID=UPI000382B3DB|nr:AI-2E family transporter [Caldibacillus debilis]
MDIKMKWFYRLAFLLLLFIVLFVFFKLQPFWHPVLTTVLKALFPFAVAAFIAYLLYPLIRYLQKNGLPKALSVLIIYLLFFGGAGVAIYKGLPALLDQLKELSANAPYVMEQYENWVSVVERNTKTWPDGFKEEIDQGFAAVNETVERLAEKTLSFFFWIVDSFIILTLIPFIAFFMIKDMEVIQKAFWSVVPEKWKDPLRDFFAEVDRSLGGYIRGQLIVCTLIGGLSSLLFWWIKMKYPLILGLIVGVTNVIPYFGPIIGAVPAVVIAATVSFRMAVYVVLILFILQFLEGNIISPYVVGKSVDLHPLFIILSILIGEEAGGVLGLVLAVPIVAILKTALLELRRQMKGKERAG